MSQRRTTRHWAMMLLGNSPVTLDALQGHLIANGWSSKPALAREDAQRVLNELCDERRVEYLPIHRVYRLTDKACPAENKKDKE